MKATIFNNLSSLYRHAADVLLGILKDKKDAVLALATGRTPERLYDIAVEDFLAGKADYGLVTTFNLDEYAGIDEKSPQSFRFFMEKMLFEKVNLRREGIHFLNGKASNLEAECERYSSLLKAHPRDLQVLGLGVNGHIGFNEPTLCPKAETHVVKLTESTKQANADFFGGASFVPDFALTMGIEDILSAKKILLLATGEGKADALFNTFYCRDERVCPSASLQRHQDVLVLCDSSAAMLLKPCDCELFD